MGQVNQISELPNAIQYQSEGGEYGDAFAVGESEPYDLYILTRPFEGQLNAQWFNIGQFPAPSYVPGPMPTVDIGTVEISEYSSNGAVTSSKTDTGVLFNFVLPRGSRWFVNDGDPYIGGDSSKWDCALNARNGNVFQLKKDNQTWELIGNIAGPAPSVRIGTVTRSPNNTDPVVTAVRQADGTVVFNFTLPAGPQGIQGLQGVRGPAGPQGQFITIFGELSSTSLLPDPRTSPREAAYIIPDDVGVNHIWLITGETTEDLVWTDVGSFGGGSKITASNENVLEYDATYVDGNQSRQIRAITIKEESNGINNVTIGARSEFTNSAGQSEFTLYDINIPLEDTETIVHKTTDTGIGFALADTVKAKIENALQSTNIQSIVYGTDVDGNQTYYKAFNTSVGNAVVLRQGNGEITVPSAPQANTDATSKKYVDDQDDHLDQLIQANSDGIAARVQKSGDTMTGILTAPNVKLSNVTSNTNPTMLAGWSSNLPSNGFCTIDIKQMFLDYAYPVGTIYMTMNADLNTAAKMNAKFGGTWTHIESGRFLESNGTATTTTTKNAGVPNIKGTAGSDSSSYNLIMIGKNSSKPCYFSGAFGGTFSDMSGGSGSGNGYIEGTTISFNANSGAVQSGIYRDDCYTVQPKSQTVWMWRRTA